MHGWVGRKDRQAVAIDAVVHRGDGSRQSVRLCDLSEDGCRIECSSDLRIGEQLAIDIPRLGQLKAQIRWALLGSAGARFVDQPES